MPPIKKHFQIPLKHFSPIVKKMPPIKTHFQIPLTHLPPLENKMPSIKKKHFQILEKHLPLIATKLEKMPPIKKNNYHLKIICHNFFQICQSQMGLR